MALKGSRYEEPTCLWSTVPVCPTSEKWINLASGIFEGWLLAYAARKFNRLSAQCAGGSFILDALRTRYPAGISWNTVLLAFASLFADISSEMFYPILPIFLTQVLHGSGGVVGVVDVIAEATENVIQGFSGWLSDKLQKRKALALIGYFVSAMGKPLMGIATAWPGVLGGRFLDRFGAGFRSAPRDALIASSVSDEYRGRAFGLKGIGDHLVKGATVDLDIALSKYIAMWSGYVGREVRPKESLPAVRVPTCWEGADKSRRERVLGESIFPY